MTPSPARLLRAACAALLAASAAHAAELPALEPSAAESPVDTGRIAAVTLSSGGMAHVRRAYTVDGAQVLRIQAPLREVDDWLKSLLVRDPAGKVAGVTLDGPEPLQATFRALPFGPDDMAALPRLAGALAGVRARAASGGRTVEGVILGVATPETPELAPDGRPLVEPAPRLSMLTAPGRVETLRLGADATLEILDEAMRERLQAAAGMAGRSRTQDARTVSIALEGEGRREVWLDALVAAPVWKASYRLLVDDDGKARLQGWAVIENATGEDWRDVELTLTTGAPVMYAQSLYRHVWHERPTLAVHTGAAAPPRVDDSAERAPAMAEMAAGRVARASFARPAPAPMAAAPAPSGAAGATQADEGATAATYRLPAGVSVAAGQTLTLPFLDADVAGEAVSVFQPERGSRHPVAAVMLANDTGATLPPGILTVYGADGAHAGDAALAAVPPGESRLVSFAEDRKVEIVADTQPREDVTDVRVADGVLHATRLERLTTTYTIKGAPDAARELVIEAPRRVGWQARSADLSGETARHLRLRKRVEAGAQATVELVQERRQAQTLALLQASPEVLLRWSGASADAATAERLRELADLRRELAAAEQAVQRADEDLARAQANQARVRENLGAVPADSTLGQRYVKMLADEEDRIAELGRAREAAAAKTTALREMLGSALAKPA